ncbi:hypothetical protein DM860_014397 [Cuscuta australis]|uniref:Anoctamin transmembrane domain-containing protein n=1 Tax=Cuscuta australis TaxID=267555 RepID=A0A328DEN2_9ASTE|nr:hypothetical protein DM860_014397 [Cuscuta australis]
MNGDGGGDKRCAFEIGVVVPKKHEDESNECVEVLIDEFEKAGLLVDRVVGIQNEYIKVPSLFLFPLASCILSGVDLQFEWDEVEAFSNQPDGSLFSWSERFNCYHYLLYKIVNRGESVRTLAAGCEEVQWETGESLLRKLEFEGIVKEVFPLHDETKRKKLLKSWALNWWDLTVQPIDNICSYYGTKLPFELVFAHLYEVLSSDILKFALTAIYLLVIQYFNGVGGKISAKLVKYEGNKNIEYRADSLVYKVFGLYFMQTYIGIFYHALLHRNILTLRQVLVQRLILSEVLGNLVENSLPYLTYSFRKYRAVRKNKRKSDGALSIAKIQYFSRIEKEYLKPVYSASIGEELEDGLFDDFLELALQFGMIMMFACAFPLGFAFATLNNITEIRTDALKLLAIFRRPIPRPNATIGAWLNIFQFLIVMSICTNCVLLVCLYDREGTWKMSPGLAAILIMEHVLLLIKAAFSHLVPAEPEWVRANRAKNASYAQDMCSRQLLRSISNEKMHKCK